MSYNLHLEWSLEQTSKEVLDHTRRGVWPVCTIRLSLNVQDLNGRQSKTSRLNPLK